MSDTPAAVSGTTRAQLQRAMNVRSAAAVDHARSLPDGAAERRAAHRELWASAGTMRLLNLAGSVYRGLPMPAELERGDAEHIADAARAVAAARALVELGAPDREPSDELRALVEQLGEPKLKSHEPVAGYASITDVAYELHDMWGPFYEIISTGSFEKTVQALADDRSETTLKIQHAGLGLAITRGDSGLLVIEDEQGLGFAGMVDTRQHDASDLVRKLETNMISGQTSMAGWIYSWHWDDSYTILTVGEWDLHRGDVAAVAAGANPWGWIDLGRRLSPPPAVANDDPSVPADQRDADPDTGNTEPPAADCYRGRQRRRRHR